MSEIDWSDRTELEKAVREYGGLEEWTRKRKERKREEKALEYFNKIQQKKLKEEARLIEKQRQEESRKKELEKQEKYERRKRLEEFRGEYMDYRCASCDGKLKIVYTKWSTTHFAKSICENCNKFDRWIPHPKPDNEFK